MYIEHSSIFLSVFFNIMDYKFYHSFYINCIIIFTHYAFRYNKKY